MAELANAEARYTAKLLAGEMPADIEMLTRELNLKETTPTTLDALYSDYGADWFGSFQEMMLLKWDIVAQRRSFTMSACG